MKKSATKIQESLQKFNENEPKVPLLELQMSKKSMKSNRKENKEEKWDIGDDDRATETVKIDNEIRKFERYMEDRIYSPVSNRRTQTEIGSPNKFIMSPVLINPALSNKKSKPEILVEELLSENSPRIANQTEGDEYKLEQSKRKYIIRNTKRSYNQEEILRNMHNFEEKLEKLIQVNKDNASQLQVRKFNQTGHHRGHRKTASLLVNTRINTSPNHIEMKEHKSPTLMTHIGDKIQGFSSEKATFSKTIYDPKTTESPNSIESRLLTQRLASSLHIKKNSDLHSHLSTFSNQLYGNTKGGEIKKLEFTSFEGLAPLSSCRSAVFATQNSPMNTSPATPLLKFTSYISKRNSCASICSTLTSREPFPREPLTVREQFSKMLEETSKVSSSRSQKALIAKKKERVTLESFKKIREKNHAYATAIDSTKSNKFFAVECFKSTTNE